MYISPKGHKYVNEKTELNISYIIAKNWCKYQISVSRQEAQPNRKMITGDTVEGR